MRGDMAVVELNDVKRHYETAGETVRALDGVTLDIEAGEFVAIAGPSGSGKSTLLNLVGALDVPDSGTVLIDGNDLSKLSRTARAELRRDKLGFVFQAYNLIPVLTAIENVEYVQMLQGVDKAKRRQRAAEVLSQVGLDGMFDRRPAKLSGGQQQRVAVARAIASNPALVLADEPTANLDSTTSAALLDTMADLNRDLGVTFVFATHDPRVMARASRLIRLVDGEVESDEKR
jgi:putative ABC transport system ATP-binding protein